ncbi:MAG: hypothetical protein ACI4XM_05775 [Candidatus Coprovivens sp.]
MNIGIDIDDTITHTYETLLPMVAIRYGMNLKKLQLQKPSYAMLRNMLPNYETFASESLPVVAKIVPLRDGVIDVLTKLREQGHKIIFMTARNNAEYKDPYKISHEFLEVNGVPYDKLLVNIEDKAQQCIVENIDLFIDDNNDNCRLVHKTGIETWQFGTIFTQKIKGIDRVDSWNEVYNRIQEMCA